MDWFLFTASGDGNEGEGEGTGGFLLCHDKIYLTPPKALQYSNDPNHLQSVLYSPHFILSYRRLIPSPFPLPKNSSGPPPLTDKLLTGSEIHKSDVTFSAVVPISQGRAGGVVKYQYTRKKIDKIPQNTPNSSKNTQK